MLARPTTDLDLLAAFCESQDLEAFDGIVDRYEFDLLGLACSFLRDDHAAQDVVQDCFISLSRKASEVLEQGRCLKRPDACLKPWLHRVVRNACIDRVRRVAHRKRRELDEGQLPAQAEPESLATLGDDVALLLWQRVDELSPLQRSVVLLRYRDGHSYQDIAERLGKTVNHIGVLLNKAFGRLRQDPRLRAEVLP